MIVRARIDKSQALQDTTQFPRLIQEETRREKSWRKALIVCIPDSILTITMYNAQLQIINNQHRQCKKAWRNINMSTWRQGFWMEDEDE
jgi:hypothetical protein